jgi:hypothetical protein
MRQLLGFYNNKKEKETSAINNNIIISYLYFILRLRHVSENDNPFISSDPSYYIYIRHELKIPNLCLKFKEPVDFTR